MKLETGSKCIDDILGGGVETGTITQIYGESGTGKTSLCLMLAYNTAKEFSVAYIDTEGLSAERIDQIFEDKSVLSNIYIYEVFDFRQQSTAVKELARLLKSREIKLIIIDSLTALYRSELEDESRQIRVKRELTSQLTFLLGLARKHDLAVVFTNQMFTDVNSGEIRPIGGPSIDHLSKTIISLEKTRDERIARLVKHRSMPEGIYCFFKITNRGVEP
ncbi:DNA repair and recombination protein RadB [Geoglobus acetivorans]|uniref:DNA repair and recombination protein RadB n=1 Tax=Geoglobus acetivorans TaxID=565033 RepID=A0A0A7GAP7_GEOAI|nr:DNA repair and recombination protein RadB [Geoglobus acetivorans]